jgi:hypothetical protein
VIGVVVAWTVIVLLAVAMLRLAALSDADDDAALAEWEASTTSAAEEFAGAGRKITLELSETERDLLEAAG